MVSAVVIVITTLLFSVFFSGMGVAFTAFNKFKLQIDKTRGGLLGRIAGIFLKTPAHYTTTLLTGNVLALVLYTFGMSAIFGLISGDLGFLSRGTVSILIQAVVSSILILLILEFIPRIVFLRSPNIFLRALILPLFLLYIVLYPIAKLITLLAVGLLRLFGARVRNDNHLHGFDRGDLNQMLEEVAACEPESEEEEQEIRLFRNALDFSELKVRDCMVPRVDIEAIEINAAIDELAAKFVDTNYSRIFIYDGSIDNIVGYVNTKSMFRMPATIREVLMEVDYVPESLSAQKLLSMFTKKHHAIAVVVDEFGGTAGMVSMEDVLEEIFGDIEDEHDENDLVEKSVGNNTYVLSCRLEVDYLNEKYSLGIPESEEYDTLAGYIIYYYEGIPSQGEVIRIDDKEIKILRMSGSKLELARIHVF